MAVDTPGAFSEMRFEAGMAIFCFLNAFALGNMECRRSVGLIFPVLTPVSF